MEKKIMSVELKIKSKHLSEEAKIIRFEERKLRKQVEWEKEQYYAVGSNEPYTPTGPNYWTMESIKQHRRWDVRNENRATFLARAYIDGKIYASTEARRKPENEYKFNTYILPRVVNMVAKYGAKKMPIKIWDSTLRAHVENPEFIELKEKIKTWASPNLV